MKSLFDSVDADLIQEKKLKKEEAKRDKLQIEYDRLSKAMKSTEAANAIIQFMSQTQSIKVYTIYYENPSFHWLIYVHTTFLVELMKHFDILFTVYYIQKDPLYTPLNEHHPFMSNKSGNCLIM